jgi:hypothetical protein
MLKGEAKVAYQREYMRRKRAGLPTAIKPKPREWKPTQRMIDELEWWAKYPSQRRSRIADRVLDGLILDNDESWWEACRRYKRLQDERRAERKADKEQEKKFEEERKILHCSFCREPMTETDKPRWMGMGYERRDGTKVYDAIICEPCVTEFAKKFAKQKHWACARRQHQADEQG